MTARYEVVKAKSPQEALEKSIYKIGDLVKITVVDAIANSDGTYSVIPTVEPQPKK